MCNRREAAWECDVAKWTMNLDTNPMKPITRKNIGRNWEKGSGGKYEPHIGTKQKMKVVMHKKKFKVMCDIADGKPISEQDALNFNLKMILVRRGYKLATDGDYYVKYIDPRREAAVKASDIPTRTENATEG